MDSKKISTAVGPTPFGVDPLADPTLPPGGTLGSPAEPIRWKRGYIALFVLAAAAVMLAQLAPSTFSLAVRIQQLDPAGKDVLLPIVLTVPAVLLIAVNPIVGILSDTTRSRIGRRRPWMLGGLAFGLLGLLLIAFAGNVGLVIAGWTIGYLGLTTTSAMFVTHMGDRLPLQQRGLVVGINGAVQQIAPIVGILVSGGLVGMPVLLFAVPGIIAIVGTVPFILRMNDPSTVHEATQPVKLGAVFRHIVFSPKKHPDLGWAWISKLFVFVALYCNSVYAVYFLQERLEMDAGAVAGIMATVGGLSIPVAMIGALGAGVVSDKLKRRKLLIYIAAAFFVAGLLTIGFTQSVAVYIIGSVLFTFGSGIFGSVDQALTLDVLPDREQSGRWIAIMALANEIPKALAPVLAGALVLLGGGYSGVYYLSAVCALVGCLLVIPIKKTR
jgi:MFS family permease